MPFSRRTLLAALPLTLVACAAPPPAPPPPAGPAFDAFGFFAGRTRGRGVLTGPLGRRAPVAVEGTGTLLGGTLTLVQVVREGAAPPRTRRWTLSRTGPGRYAGTLTDAEGPVEGEERGPRLVLRYRAKGGYAVEQVLDRIAPGIVRNRLTARAGGLTLAQLDETIRRL